MYFLKLSRAMDYLNLSERKQKADSKSNYERLKIKIIVFKDKVKTIR